MLKETTIVSAKKDETSPEMADHLARVRLLHEGQLRDEDGNVDGHGRAPYRNRSRVVGDHRHSKVAHPSDVRSERRASALSGRTSASVSSHRRQEVAGAADAADAAVVLLGGGLRPGEAFALQWSDVNEIGSSVTVRQNLIRIRGKKGYELRKPKTKKSRRMVPLPASAWTELMRWRKQQKRQRLMIGEEWRDLGFVFTTSKGTPLHGARRSFARVSAKAGLGEWGEEPKRAHPTGPLPAREFTPSFRIYDLRHTYVSLLLMQRLPVNVVADLAGHEKASFTIARYGHAMREQVGEAVQTLESLLFTKTG